jgi:hypothetical protein
MKFEAYIKLLASTIPEMMRDAARQDKEVAQWLAVQFGLMHHALRKIPRNSRQEDSDYFWEVQFRAYSAPRLIISTGGGGL